MKDMKKIVIITVAWLVIILGVTPELQTLHMSHPGDILTYLLALAGSLLSWAGLVGIPIFTIGKTAKRWRKK